MEKKAKRLYMFYLHGKFKNPQLEDFLINDGRNTEFYIDKSGKEELILYGFTEDKDVAISFMAERNMKRFGLVARNLTDLWDDEIADYIRFKREYSSAELLADNITTRKEVELSAGRYLQTCESVPLVVNRFEMQYLEDYMECFSDNMADIFLTDETDKVLNCFNGKLIHYLKEMGLKEVMNFIEDFTGNVCLDEFFLILSLFGELFNKKEVRKKK